MGIYGNSILEYTLDIVNEAYIGKTPTLLEIEKQIGIIRQNAAKHFKDINRSKEVQALNRLFEKQFGMEIFSLHVEQSLYFNAYTIPVAKNYDVCLTNNLENIVEASQSAGYRFKKNNKFCIICTVTLGLLNSAMSDAEILAVILHEIGHNFADCINNTIKYCNKIQMDIMLGQSLGNIIKWIYYDKKYPDNFWKKMIVKRTASIATNTNVFKSLVSSFDKEIKINGVIQGVLGIKSDIEFILNRIINSVNIKNLATTGLMNVVLKFLCVDKFFKKYSPSRFNEVIADKFATIYGYGPELTSALIKFDSEYTPDQKIMDKIPVIGTMVNNINREIFRQASRYDCHPLTMQRANEAIKTLKVELNNSDLDPKLNAALKAQIKELEKTINETIKLNDDPNIPKDKKKIVLMYADVLANDPDAVSKEWEKKLQDSFDNLLK